MGKFKEELLKEQARSKGEEMEQVIVDAWNGVPHPQNPKYDIPEDAGARIVEKLRAQGVTGDARVIGQDNVDVTKKWSSFWNPSKVPASTKTPKADFLIGNYQISLKSGDAAQLMSGGKNESVATFYSAVEKLENSLDSELQELSKAFENLASSSIAKGDLRSEIKKAEDKLVTKANTAHKKIMGKLEKQFNKNPEFAYYFALEAMTGNDKFGDSVARATHFLTVSFDGKQANLHDANERKYVMSIANQMKPSVRFKTTSIKKKKDGKQTKTGEYRYWSVVGLIVNKLVEEVDNHSGVYLSENVLRNIVNKVKQALFDAIRKLIAFIKGSWKKFLEFMDVEVDISVNDKVKF
jgi:hypothetical protein